jgi:diadenosine tetraphosphate (Ap4A) HIT family hydrolase
MTLPVCDLCRQSGGDVIYRCEQYRVVLVDDADYPGFCRVIWNGHVKEVTDLGGADRAVVMNAVWLVEQAMREVMRPDKINLASFGNMVPHLHWHIIPRYLDDAHFPNPVWAEVQRLPQQLTLSARVALVPALCEAISRLAGANARDAAFKV